MNLRRAATDSLRRSPVVRRAVRLAKAKLPPEVKRRLRGVQRSVLGKRTATTTKHRLALAKASFGTGDYDDALTHVGKALTADPRDVAALELASRIEIKRGRYGAAATHATKRVEVTKNPQHWGYARKLAGRVRETDPAWRPVIAAAPPSGPVDGPVDRPARGRTLYLAKESRPFLHNGFCTRTHETLQALTRAGRDVLGVTMPGFPGVLGVEEPPSESVVEEVTYRHLLPAAGKPLRALAFDEYVELTARVLAKVVTDERPSLLHVASGHRGFDTALPGSAVARWAGLPWMYEVRSFFEATWTDDARYAESAEYYERRFATEGAMMRDADLVVTLSGPMRAEIIDTHGVPAEKVRVVPNAVDLTRFVPEGRDTAAGRELRARLGLGDSFTLGYVSNLSHPREGQEVLIEAVATLRSQGHDVSGLLVGDGNRRAELEALARRLGCRDHVVFTGNVPFEDVAGHYAQIDLFVVPRVQDRAARMVSPMKPFEAMAMRVPLLLADLPALTEIAGIDEEEPRAHTFTAGDAASLAAAARRLIEAPAERDRLVEAAATWVAAERSWSAVAGAMAAAYDDLSEVSRLIDRQSSDRSRRMERAAPLEASAC